MTAVTRADVVAAARAWIGVPFRHLGRDRHGVDCIGLVVMVCQALRLSDYDIPAYERRPDTSAFLRHFRAAGAQQIAIHDAGPGDLLAMREHAFPCHIAILSEMHGVQHMIHAYAPLHRVTEEPLIDAWKSKRVAAFSIPGVG